ncbi:hypothetical protein FSARC_7057 [Fusarium sarcochroum]|uniref:Complex I intermediate-associated protein 84, mitochondrial n=1 Tax=Fusarium sarcochroum TaxID=1208366 RepID=A0A8H4TW82_9HYPO|nr:hypothetical protein FSARC_7057 [Fusarium sarcochroum]
MRAQLARHARRVLIQHARNPTCAVYSAPLRRRYLPRTINNGYSRRTFFDGLFSKAPREVRQPEFEPGWQTIMVWRSRMLDNLRPPPTEELIQAWKTFFEGKLDSKVPLNGTQAMQCLRLLDYLVKQHEESPKSEAKLQVADLRNALLALERLRPRERTRQHLDLAKSIWSAIDDIKITRPGFVTNGSLWSSFLRVLCTFDGSRDALKMVYANWEDVMKLCGKKTENPILSLMEGLAREGCEKDLLHLLKGAIDSGYPYDKHVQFIMVNFFAQRNRIPETKYWIDQPLKSPKRSFKIYPLIATFAVRNNLKDWAVPYFLELGTQLENEEKEERFYWDALMQGILILGKGLAEVRKWLFLHETSDKPGIRATPGTINVLLHAAVGIKDPVLVEDILALAAEMGIQPNGESHIYLMQVRLEAGYLPGVHASYKKVVERTPWHNQAHLWWEFSQLMNEYLAVLSSQTTPNFKLISEIIEQCEEDQLLLEPETVASLCIRFLENEQHFDVMDILSVHSFQFSATEREVIQDAFVKFCIDPLTSTSRSWTGYQILRQFFQDLSFDHRVKLMEAFFNRNRPDMATHVFGHMRQHRNNDYHPKRETYISCFEGLSRSPDEDSLEMVHNMLKMDTTVEPNTKLYTSLILAYTASEKPTQTMDFWQAITASREGPSYASLEAVFWSLERTPRGAKEAHKIWKRIERMDIDVPPAVYNAYIGAVAASGEEEKVQDIITRMAVVTESEPDAMTLGVAFNAFPGQKLQANFKGWATVRYLDAWAKLESKGKRLNKDSLCQYKLKRILRA